MDSLPEECIVLILSFTAASPRSLHALLLTSRTLFRLAAATLYYNPFEYLERHFTDIHDRQVKVLRLLLACTPDTLDAITTASSPSSAASLPGFRRPTIDYLALYGCHFEKILHYVITPALSCIPNSVSTILLSQQDSPQRQASKTSLLSDQSLSSPSPQPQAQAQSQPRRLLTQLTGIPGHIHRGLVGHSPQHIRTIGYSIHGLNTLLPLVDQLSRLVRLELYKKKLGHEISTATEFISAHRRVHQSLQEIKLKSNDQLDLTPLILAMGQPHTIDVSNWTNAEQYLHLFPLQQCRVLLMRQALSRSAFNPSVDVLAQLVNVQVLRMPAFHQRMFSWAIGESAEPKRVLSQLPALTSISLYGLDTHMITAFADAVAAFHGALQTLVGLSSFHELSNTALSWSQSLPRLTRLDLEGTIALRFDLNCLRHCPVIRELRLNIARKIPQDWNPSLKAQQLAQVSPSLRSLDIGGWWRLPANCFTETLLPVFQRLQRLNVMWCDGPTVDVVLQLLSLLPSLSWLGIIATQQEYNQVLERSSFIHPSLELDVYLNDE